MFDDNTMLVYGGYSQRCGDYCDDVWSFDLRDNTWMEIYPLGHFAEGEVFRRSRRRTCAYVRAAPERSGAKTTDHQSSQPLRTTLQTHTW